MKFAVDKFLTAFAKGFGPLNSSQKAGIQFLLSKVENDPKWPNDLRQIAYFLGTIFWESGRTFQPVKEKRARVGTELRRVQDRYWNSGYYGRGYIQLTLRANYEKFGLSKNPALAYTPDIAYDVAARGMRDGIFTKRKLSQYFNSKTEDYVGARAIVNTSTDKPHDIALIAIKIQACLSLALVPEKVEEAPSPDVVVEVSESPKVTIADRAKTTLSIYKDADESTKSLVSRLGSLVWVGLAGFIAYLQTHQMQFFICLVVLILGFVVFHYYSRRQDKKTEIMLGGGNG